MGTSHSDFCNTLCGEIWGMVHRKKIWLSVAHIPGKQNKIADTELRPSEKESEWMLDPETLRCSLNKLKFEPDVDLFASQAVSKLCSIQTQSRCFSYLCL